jgi:hypothetical protein
VSTVGTWSRLSSAETCVVDRLFLARIDSIVLANTNMRWCCVDSSTEGLDWWLPQCKYSQLSRRDGRLLMSRCRVGHWLITREEKL